MEFDSADEILSFGYIEFLLETQQIVFRSLK